MSSTDTEALRKRADLNNKGSRYNLEDWITQQCKPYSGMKVLDLGCGTGKQVFPLADLVSPGGFVLGLDISGEAIKEVNEKAKSKNKKLVKAIKCSFDDCLEIIKDQTYDLILSSYAIYYAKDMVSLLSGLRDRLSPNGQLFICGPGRGTNQEMTNLINEIFGNLGQQVLDDFIDEQSIRLVGSNYSKYRIVRLCNEITFNSSDSVLLWWKNHISFVPEIYSLVRLTLDSYFTNTNTFSLTKNVLGVHYFV